MQGMAKKDRNTGALSVTNIQFLCGANSHIIARSGRFAFYLKSNSDYPSLFSVIVNLLIE